MAESSQRSTCWSITINNPVPSDLPVKEALPAKWSYEGQLEEGKEGTTHYQGMLLTPQVRFSQVKKIFPRAHIEVAKNKTALQKYVHKEDTRLVEIPTVSSSVPTLFDYQSTVAGSWVPEKFDEWVKKLPNEPEGEVALMYVDSLVSEDIKKGVRGIEFIAINPMWRSSWKKFYRSIIFRHQNIKDATQTLVPEEEPTEEESCQEEELQDSGKC